MAHWCRLREETQAKADFNESSLQRSFDERFQGSYFTLVAAPNWLLARATSNSRSRFSDIKADVLWLKEEATLIELKRGNKNEEYALAQALQYAWDLTKKGIVAVPVLVTSYSLRMRSALHFLFNHGLDRHCLRFLEAYYLTGSGDSRYLWLSEPFANWVDGSPPWIPPTWSRTQMCWKQVEDCDAWVCHAPGADCNPPDTPLQYGFIARVQGKANHYIVSASGDSDRYYLCDPDSQETSRPEDIPGCPF